jgi:hypothetical protein
MDAEIAANAAAFRNSLSAKLSDNVTAVLAVGEAKIDLAYARLTTLQAWRSYVLETQLSANAIGFFSEAQNDGLTSVAQVTSGLWRPSLNALRSLLENVLHCFYYADHPVEYRLWEKGDYKPPFQKLFDYFEKHPDLATIPTGLAVIPELRKHYSELSEAVHSSAKKSRMTDDLNQTQIWKTSAADIGKWSTLQKNLLRDVNLMMIALFREQLVGAKVKGLREALALAVPQGKDVLIRGSFGVRILR